MKDLIIWWSKFCLQFRKIIKFWLQVSYLPLHRLIDFFYHNLFHCLSTSFHLLCDGNSGNREKCLLPVFLLILFVLFFLLFLRSTPIILHFISSTCIHKKAKSLQEMLLKQKHKRNMLKHAIRHYLIISQNIYYNKWSRFVMSSLSSLFAVVVKNFLNCKEFVALVFFSASFNSFLNDFLK